MKYGKWQGPNANGRKIRDMKKRVNNKRNIIVDMIIWQAVNMHSGNYDRK